ncbi:unnamed protein product [Rhizoctonia solani]|uniref:Palmitoyltransferase n=1 Tax=Rhizoctonia solani TaxID=456999 RepID=A0A8H3CWC0_9AGAM|nr:unnamed protein product [Rhizoctonia solani]
MADRPRGEWDCVGVSRDIYQQKQKERQENQKPQPWILQKLAVGVVLGIVVWTYYVYVGRMCVKLLGRGDTVKAGVYIAIFNLFFLMFSWTYLKILVTPPGFARDHVPQSEAPATTQYGRPWDIDSEVRGTDDGHRTIGTAYEGMSERGHSQRFSMASQIPPDEAGTVLELDAIPPIASVHACIASPVGDDYPLGDASTTVHETQPYLQPVAAPKDGTHKGQKHVHVPRNPPQTPVLAYEYRYCARDKLMKPMRTHHCRLCATVSHNKLACCSMITTVHVGSLPLYQASVLMVGVPGIGQCVGAYNRKFFLNFTFWSTWFTAWVFGTLLADLIIDSRDINFHLDGQQVAVIALSGLFTMFTASLTASHTRLLLINATTVEALGFSRVREKDKANLETAFNLWQCRDKHAMRKRWKHEWGRIEYEGNLWWLDSARRNWEEVMGHHVWEWFLPIGKSPNDGMHYPVNPRHDPDGRWRPRSQWPTELQ